MAFESMTGNNNQAALMVALSRLPCFNALPLSQISALDAGLSQPCFQLQYQGKAYFAKYVGKGSIEPHACQLASAVALAPSVLFVKDAWLITEFIQGISLDKSGYNDADKLTQMLALLARCHAIDFAATHFTASMGAVSGKGLAELDSLTVITSLLQQVQLSQNQATVLSRLSQLLQQNLAKALAAQQDSQAVFCHGDGNFSNAIIDNNHAIKRTSSRVVLVDFECACIAPPAYDLAMLMAVNVIPAAAASAVTTKYNQLVMALNPAENTGEIVDNMTINTASKRTESSSLVTRYFGIACLINGLWYLSQYQQCQSEIYQQKAIEQFALLSDRYVSIHSVLNEMR
ncbi:Phosphotransferase enzyme family protein [Colwellia chukchiensis]|uniref:Phosphotransferase enzyme family protein n=1 Tax=Colwellia chukchiensis TaxID=641665 RepID=A0A1H7MIZ7_9GAMM|nr:phosphotransferase [Colwellia chukchiensis]SEL11290.1 Phosphotransferase enzyme family protein [Colwellia chukchiensis]